MVDGHEHRDDLGQGAPPRAEPAAEIEAVDEMPEPLACDPQGGRAREGPAGDAGQIERVGDLPCGRCDRVRAGRLGLGALRMQDSGMERIALHLLGDAVHGGDRLDRILAGRRLG